MTDTMRDNERGFAVIATTLILGIAFAVILLDVVLTGRQAGKNLQETQSAQQIAEARAFTRRCTA